MACVWLGRRGVLARGLVARPVLRFAGRFVLGGRLGFVGWLRFLLGRGLGHGLGCGFRRGSWHSCFGGWGGRIGRLGRGDAFGRGIGGCGVRRSGICGGGVRALGVRALGVRGSGIRGGGSRGAGVRVGGGCRGGGALFAVVKQQGTASNAEKNRKSKD